MHQPTTNETPSAPPIEWYDLTFSDVTARNQTHYARLDLALRTDVQLPDVRVGGEAVKINLDRISINGQWARRPPRP